MASSFACAEIVNKTINPTVYLAIITQHIMTAKQQHKDYSCMILKDLRPSESVSLYNICAGTDHGMNANWTPSLSLSCFKWSFRSLALSLLSDFDMLSDMNI